MTQPDIIDTIDDALDDWSVSDDAMRWAPDSATIEPSLPPFDFAAFNDSVQTMAVAVNRAARKMAQRLVNMSRTINKFAARLRERQAARQHQPVALSINGHEYHRRRKARARRH